MTEGPKDPFADPGWLAYADRALDELLPMMQSSRVCLSLVPKNGADVKFALELGFMIMLDKPIIAVVFPGAKVPAKLAMVADAIVEGDVANMDEMGERLGAEIKRVIDEAKEDGDD